MTQLNEALFEQYIGVTYPYSIIKYVHGIGKLIDGTDEINAEWALSVGLDGNVRFFVVPMEPFLRRNAPLAFSGITDDGMTVRATRLKAIETKIDSDNPNVTSLIHLLPETEIMFQREGAGRLALLKAYLLNAHLEGEEYVDRGDRSYLEKVTLPLGKHTALFFLDQHHEQLRIFARNGWLTAVALSRIEVSFQIEETVQTALAYLEDIIWLISFVCQQITAPPVIDFFDEAGALIYRKILPVSQHRLHHGHLFKRSQAIVVSAVIKQLYEPFTRDEYNIGMRKMTGFLCALNETTYVELKMSTLIMAYEYLLSRYLLNRGAITESDLTKEGFNIQKKLGKANTYLRFIPSELMGDSLRTVRNPLFHQGLLALDYPDFKQLFDEYRNLLLRIILHILAYDGYYNPPGIGPAKHVKTGEAEKFEIILPPDWAEDEIMNSDGEECGD